jgi:hypothetical protein
MGAVGNASAAGGSGGTSGKGGSGGGSGKGGSGGSAGKGGNAGTGGSAGAPGTALGAVCDDDGDCGSGLTCLEHDEILGDGPAHGACTIACSSDTTCQTKAAGARCVSFAGAEYCVAACELGPATAPKCHDRTDAMCGLLGVIPGSDYCSSTADCGAGELCQDYYCGEAVLGCLPSCRGDFDCGSGQKCDFETGLCIDTTPVGLPLGSACSLDAATDPCNGFCFPSGTAYDGYCSAYCGFNDDLSSCGWNGSGVAPSACFWTSVLQGSLDIAQTDLGFCGKLCDCNTDCTAVGDYCLDDDADLKAVFQRNGYCRPLASGETVDDTYSSCL